MRVYRTFIKQFMDLFVSLLILICSFPVLLLIGVLILLFCGRPVVFRQQRPGLHGKPFWIYKFRTMSDDRDAAGNLLSDEQRLSRFGAFVRSTSLDELPGLINVLRGEMSLVGPRPLLKQYLDLYSAEQARRHEVKPGVTGWVQVNGRNAISWEDKFKLDVWYVDHQSFLLDMKILLLTFVKVFKREGVSQQGQVTMEEFKGSVK